MDVVNFDALVAQERKILASQVDLDRDYFILGHFDNRRRDFKATDYPIYAISARELLAQVTGNADRQMTASTTPTSTTDDNYIDLIGMSLSTNELDPISLGATGNYQIHFSCSYQLSDLGSSAEFVLNIGGVDILPTEVIESPNNTGIYRTSIVWQVDSLPANQIIKVRFKITPATPTVSLLSVLNRVLMIDGANTLNVI